jgi:hypothetical protein
VLNFSELLISESSTAARRHLMSFEIRGNSLRTSEGATVPFDYPISEVVEVGGLLIVLLDAPPKESMPGNVFGVLQSGHVAWQIEPMPSVTINPVDRYTGIFPPSEGRV